MDLTISKKLMKNHPVDTFCRQEFVITMDFLKTNKHPRQIVKDDLM